VPPPDSRPGFERLQAQLAEAAGDLTKLRELAPKIKEPWNLKIQELENALYD
jgi:hypothetical protein